MTTAAEKFNAGWTYKGYQCFGGFSCSCPVLKLYGYRGPVELHAAIRKVLRAREKKA